MNGPRRRLPVFFVPTIGLLTLLILLVFLPTAHARDNEAANRFYEGTHIFRRILFELHLEPLGSFAELGREDPRDTLLVVLGKADLLADLKDPEGSIVIVEDNVMGYRPRAELKGLKDYLDRGGAVLLATDQAMPPPVAKEVENVTGVRLAGQTLAYRRQRGDVTRNSTYRGLDYCPLLQWVPGSVPNLFRDPETGGNDLQVATNVPSYLVREGPRRAGMYELATLSTCVVDPPESFAVTTSGYGSSGFVRQQVVTRPLFAVGGRVGRGSGRVLVLGDHSIFINEMMLPTKINNVEFTYNCLGWLQDTGGIDTRKRPIKRHKVLFLEEGTVQTNFNLPLKEVPELPLEALPTLLAKLQNTITEAEDDDGLSERLLDWLEEERPGAVRGLARWSVYVLGLLAFLYLAYRLGVRGRSAQDRAAPLLAEAVARQQGQVIPPLLQQRQEAQLAAGNFWEAAHELARQTFTAAGISTASAWPRVWAEGSWWQRWTTLRRVRRLWRLAHDSRPVPVSPTAFRRLLRDLAALKSALANGTIHLAPA